MSAVARLERLTFTTSRLAEFCTRRELERQTGHSGDAWPLYVVKELLDNAADASEEAGIAPSVHIEIGDERITVSDAGPGIPEQTVRRLLDLGSRTSSRAHHIAPLRGAQGQALSTIFVMAHALEPGCERPVVIETQGLAHDITLQVDPLSGDPELVHQVSIGSVNSGTKITVWWPKSACTILAAATDEFLPLVLAYAVANPHMALRLSTPAGDFAAPPIDRLWQKWRPSDPTSPLWYNSHTFARLVRAQIAHDRERGRGRLLRDFLREFDGLSGTTKRKTVLDAAGLYRASLDELVQEGGIDGLATAALLRAMQAEVRPIKPVRLGIIGEANLRRRILNGDAYGFVYAKAAGVDSNDFPYLVEGCFTCTPQSAGRQLIKAANFASAPNLSFGLSRWESAEALLESRYVGPQEQLCVFLHVVHPQLNFTDLGKTRIALPWAVAADLRGVIEKITAAWERQKRREIKSVNAELRRRDALERKQKISVKESVYKHLPAVYPKWAGSIGAVCRQLFYGLRPLVLADTGRQDLDDAYIQYGLIPDFIAEHPDLCSSWTVLYDDRGHLIEPHTHTNVGLGTRNVRQYCGTWQPPIASGFQLQRPSINTYGPSGRYGAIHFCEKEGFNELFQKYGLDARYDAALASTKGTSVTAARELFEEAGRAGVPIFALVDFDYNGFEIAATLRRDTRRYQFKKPPDIIIVGLRLEDVRRLALEAEPVSFGKRDLAKIRENLRRNGASDEEIAFLVDGSQRVEINAVPTPDLVAMIQAAFFKAGVQKVIPETEILGQYFTKELEYHRAKQAVAKAIRQARKKIGEIVIPDDLEKQVRSYLKDNPAASWDTAIRAIISGEEDEP